MNVAHAMSDNVIDLVSMESRTDTLIIWVIQSTINTIGVNMNPINFCMT